ncbi:MAG: invasion associated locus B family protein [Sagittula sp.]|uniref:invasion associated locus B family protein n=1 Tax=Sagittula sp. TaxID=2038081 RepID=UPI0040589B38
MKNPALLLSLIAALAAAPAYAQTTDTAGPDEAPAAEAPAAETDQEQPSAPAVGGDLDLGTGDAATAGQQQQQQPQPYIKETFSDWAMQCIKVPQRENEICQMYQLLTDGQGASVAEVSIFRLENGGQAVAGGTFIVPLETLLTQKLTVTVDGGSARQYDFSFCAQIGCYARVGFTAEDIARFKAGAKAQVTIVPALAPDQKVTVDMSLAGFTAAFDAAQEYAQ